MATKQKTYLTLGSLIDWSTGFSEMSDTMRSRKVRNVWNDSRKVQKGDLFVAFRTESDDGHRFVKSAIDNGAIAVVVDKKGIATVPDNLRKKCIVVTDTLRAVHKIAARYRKEMELLVIGITGSNGKTTTRSFISSVLKQVVKVGETYTNWNNHIGVPLSVLRFDGDEWAGVLEMGANHENEIRPLTKIVSPDIAVISNIGYAHVGLFGSLEKTTNAKFEIAEGLNPEGFMLLNGDDPRLVKGAAQRGLKSVFFGMSARCDVRATDIVVDPKKGVTFAVEGRKFILKMPGRHFVYCVLPAIHIAQRCNIPYELVYETVAQLGPVSMRGIIEKKKGIDFIVDCYNANPGSMESAIRYLCDITASASSRVAVVGDMLELGVYSKKLHRKIGATLAKSDVRRIIAVGEFASEVVDGARKQGMAASRVFKVQNAEEALQKIKTVVNKGDTVLLKGSRSVKLENVFEGF